MWAHPEQVWSEADRRLVGLSQGEGEKQLEQGLKDKHWDKQMQLSFDHWARDFPLVKVQSAVAQTAEDLLEQTWCQWKRSG